MAGGRSTLLLRASFALSVLATAAGVVPLIAPASATADTGTVALSDPTTQVTYTGTPQATNPEVAPENPVSSVASPAITLQSSMIGRESGEPTVGVTKSGTVFFPGDAFDTPGGVAARNLQFRSTDGGVTWTDVSPTAGNVGNDANTHPVTLDTITYVDKDYDRVFTVDTLAAEGSVLSFSDDEGATWTTSLALAAGVNDHETITTGVVPAGSNLVTLDPDFPKIVYYCVNTVAAVSCSRSLDGGLTFTQTSSPFPTHPTQNLPLSALCSSLTGHIQTDSKGNLFVHSAWNEVAGCGIPAVAVSTDGGTTWTDYTVSSAIKDNFNQTSLSVDTSGNLYDVWQDDTHNLPYLSVSHDLGKTWSTPVMVAPPGVKTTNFPDIAAGDDGRVALSFPGSTDADANANGSTAPWSYYVVFSDNALDAAPTFTSQIAQIPAAAGGGTIMHRGACHGRCGGLFDFLDIQIAPTAGGAAYATLSDDCTGACATPAGGKSDDPDAGAGILVREIAGPAQTGDSPVLVGDVGPELPESSWPVLLPGLASAALGLVLLRRRRAARTAR
jgi:hypothetical protein